MRTSGVMARSEDYYVWWLSEKHCSAIGDPNSYFAALWLAPEYIKSEYRSRFGRPGRGRLWVADKIWVDEIKWRDDVAERLGLGKCGGIVILSSDYSHIKDMPGIVTDMNMNLISANNESAGE